MEPTGQQDGVFPHQIVILDAVLFQNQKPLSVNVNRMLHRVERPAVVGQTHLDDVPNLEPPLHVHRSRTRPTNRG